MEENAPPAPDGEGKTRDDGRGTDGESRPAADRSSLGAGDSGSGHGGKGGGVGQKKKRPWFQFSLSTVIVGTIIFGGFLGVNLRPLLFYPKQIAYPTHLDQDYRWYGWPIPVFDVALYSDRKMQPTDVIRNGKNEVVGEYLHRFDFSYAPLICDSVIPVVTIGVLMSMTMYINFRQRRLFPIIVVAYGLFVFANMCPSYQGDWVEAVWSYGWPFAITDVCVPHIGLGNSDTLLPPHTRHHFSHACFDMIVGVAIGALTYYICYLKQPSIVRKVASDKSLSDANREFTI